MDESSHQRRRFPLHPGEGMRVHVHNEGHVGVAEAFADDFYEHACLERK